MGSTEDTSPLFSNKDTCNPDRLEQVRKMASTTDAGKPHWQFFKDTINKARKEADAAICHIMEHEYGFSALHPGVFMSEWLGPAGRAIQGY